jgi:hypothetical protein
MGCGFSSPFEVQEATPVPSSTNVTAATGPVSASPNDAIPTSALSSSEVSREEVPPTVTLTSPAYSGSGGDAESLNVVVVHFNPSGYTRRAVLVNECIQRLVQTQLRLSENTTVHLDVTVVELCYGATPAEIDPNDFPTVKTICCRCDQRHKMWSKEQLINIALDDQYMSMETKYVAWIDSDIAITTETWVEDIIACLSQHDLAYGQIWSTCDMLGPSQEGKEEEEKPILTVNSFCSQYAAGKTYTARHHEDRDYWHPGFGWMATISAFRATNGLIAQTLGSADRHMAMSFLGLAVETVPDGISEAYLDQVLTWQEAVKNNGIALVHVPCHLKHYWHGPMHRRRYMERWEILKKHRFDPSIHIQYHHTGLYLWSNSCPPGLISDVADYFNQRDEDSKEAGDDIQFFSGDVGSDEANGADFDGSTAGAGDDFNSAAAAATTATVIASSDPPPSSDPVTPPPSDPFNYYG